MQKPERSATQHSADTDGNESVIERRRTWTPPTLEQLPKLTELTLVTGNSIPGGGDVGGGSTVFP